MNDIKRYSFKVITLKISGDENSPFTLMKFEFLAPNFETAQKYRRSLVQHYKNNKPYVPNWPYEETELIEIDF